MSHAAELELACEAARAAGARLRELALSGPEVLSNDGRDIKLQADRDSEALILGLLAERSPHPVLAEESGECGVIADEHGTPESGPFWVVDPLDGTLNFSRGAPLCCVSIALMEGDRPLVGVVYDFNREDLFAAEVGAGPATLNGRPMHVSDVTETGRAILSTGFPVNTDFGDEAVARFMRGVQRFKKVRLLGTAALSLAWVACGRYDAYSEQDIMLWDVAAGLALVEAAGGYVDIQPSPRKKWARRVRCAAAAGIWQEADL